MTLNIVYMVLTLVSAEYRHRYIDFLRTVGNCNILPPLLHVEVEDEVRENRKGSEEDAQQRDVRPPECLEAPPSVHAFQAIKRRRVTHLSAEAKGRQDARRRNVELDTVLQVIVRDVLLMNTDTCTDLDLVELEVAQLIDDHRLVRGVEERDSQEPTEVVRDLLSVDEQTREEQAIPGRQFVARAKTPKSLLEQHCERAHEARDTEIRE
jgi:hypothetical protein